MLKPLRQADPLLHVAAFREALGGWFLREGRDYPWRRSRDPYAVLVSEVMLQQTQVATVLGKRFYERFLEAFPNVESLARAEDEPLLKAWEGLGYYRRARMLRETARVLLSRHGGRFPSDEAALAALPGVGPYTVGALRAFAFELPAVLVDGNVARVLARLMDFQQEIDRGPALRQIWDWAGTLADPERPRVHHSALMELGQRICRPGLPDCLACPVAGFCGTRDPSALPRKRPREAPTRVEEHALWCRDRRGRLLLARGAEGERRAGLWKLPLRRADEVAGLEVAAALDYSITRYRVTLVAYRTGKARAAPREGEEWIEPARLGSLPLAAPFRRLVERLVDLESA